MCQRRSDSSKFTCRTKDLPRDGSFHCSVLRRCGPPIDDFETATRLSFRTAEERDVCDERDLCEARDEYDVRDEYDGREEFDER